MATKRLQPPDWFSLVRLANHNFLAYCQLCIIYICALLSIIFTLLDLVPAPKELHETNSAVRRAWHHFYLKRSCSGDARPFDRCCSWARPSSFLLLNPGTSEQSSVKRPDLTSTTHSFELIHQVSNSAPLSEELQEEASQLFIPSSKDRQHI